MDCQCRQSRSVVGGLLQRERLDEAVFKTLLPAACYGRTADRQHDWALRALEDVARQRRGGRTARRRGRATRRRS